MSDKLVRPYYQRQLEEELERAISGLRTSLTDTPEYAKMLTSVERLYEMVDKPKEQKPFISGDTRANIVANLLGILMIINHERLNPIGSKALGFVTRLRI